MNTFDSKTIEIFWNNVKKTKHCWNWKGYKNRQNYGQFRRNLLAHRISYELTYGPIPPGLLVLHRCDNPSCVRPDHLFLGTHNDNAQDKVNKGRSLRGENVPSSKLTLKQVKEIKKTYSKNPPLLSIIAEKYKISKQQISRILRGERWSYL